MKPFRMTLWISLLALASVAVRTASADTIRLKSAAVVDAAAPVTLAQIAELEGPKAKALADFQVAASFRELSTGAWAMIDIEQLRGMLLKRDDVAWASLEFAGSAVTIRPSKSEQAAEAPKPAEPIPTRHAEPINGSQASTETVRGQVVAQIAEQLHANVDDLRLTFENADARLLDTPLTNRTAIVQVLGTGAKVPVSVRVLEGERSVASGTIRVGTLIRTQVAIAQRVLTRADTVEEGNFTIEDRWIAPGQDVAGVSRLVGSNLRQRVNVGAIIREADLVAPDVVTKGDIVAVDCVAGSVVLTQRARALANAKQGEVIEFESLSPKEELVDSSRGSKVRVKAGPKSKFRARVDGPGRAIAIAAGTQPTSSDAPAEASQPEPTTEARPKSDAASQATPTAKPSKKLKWFPITER